MTMPVGTPNSEHTYRQATLAFQEYQFVAEDTAKLSDRRQTVNTLFVSINALFLTGVGYLIYSFVQQRSGGTTLFYYALGFLAIAIITSIINRSWLRQSEQSKNLINLRIRYLERLEGYLRNCGYFPTFEIPLRGMDPSAATDYEAPPLAFGATISTHLDAAEVSEFAKLAAARATTGAPATAALSPDDQTPQPKRWMNTRGVYTLEEVLYNNPNKKFKVFGFTQSEQIVGRTFSWSYRAAFLLALIFIALKWIGYYVNLHFAVGPFHF
ncbi:MAG TPA: hypothetical protein VF808_12660 [Ktedonobacterales bacterium]